MANCHICGKPAGLFRSAHKECTSLRQSSETEIRSLIVAATAEPFDAHHLESRIREVSRKGFIDDERLRDMIVESWEAAVEQAFEDGVLTQDEELALDEIKNHFGLQQDELDRNGSFSRLLKGVILRDVLDGITPERLKIDGNLPFNLQKTEKIVWVFQDVDYFEEKSRTRYVGGSQGVSIRIAKGLYYRTGAFKGERVQTSETLHVDTGLLGVTNKHVYFGGDSKRFRIPYRKIVAFEPFSDGFGLQRDAQTARPQSFSTGDGWFSYNLVTNLAKLSA